MDGWMDVVSFRFVGVKRMTMNEQSTRAKEEVEETFRFSLFKLHHGVSHFTFLINVRSS